MKRTVYCLFEFTSSLVSPPPPFSSNNRTNMKEVDPFEATTRRNKGSRNGIEKLAAASCVWKIVTALETKRAEAGVYIGAARYKNFSLYTPIFPSSSLLRWMKIDFLLTDFSFPSTCILHPLRTKTRSRKGEEVDCKRKKKKNNEKRAISLHRNRGNFRKIAAKRVRLETLMPGIMVGDDPSLAPPPVHPFDTIYIISLDSRRAVFFYQCNFILFHTYISSSISTTFLCPATCWGSSVDPSVVREAAINRSVRGRKTRKKK